MLTPPHKLDHHRWKHLRVGLLGGSFDPPHAGHVRLSENAMKMLCLDSVWWLVSPQNPLKAHKAQYTYEERLARSDALIKHPNILVTDIERQIGTRRTYDTVSGLKVFFSDTFFVWITGMDIPHQFHKWYRWQDLLKEISFVHLARPPLDNQVRCSTTRMLSNHRNITLTRPQRADLSPGQSFWIPHSKQLNLSSSMFRGKFLV